MSVMRNETGYRGSRLASKLGDGMHAVRGRVLDGLHRARGPTNDCAVHLRRPPQPARPWFTRTRDRSYPDKLAVPRAGQGRASSNRLPFAPAIFDMAYQ